MSARWLLALLLCSLPVAAQAQPHLGIPDLRGPSVGLQVIRLEEPAQRNPRRFTRRDLRDVSIATLGGLTLAAGLTAGTIATPESSHRLAFGRTFAATVATQPSLWLAYMSIGTGPVAHGPGAEIFWAIVILLSPLPAGFNAAIGAIAEDGASSRPTGFAASYGATLASAALFVPLTHHLWKRMNKDHRYLLQVAAMSVVGFASSVAYSYAAQLPK